MKTIEEHTSEIDELHNVLRQPINMSRCENDGHGFGFRTGAFSCGLIINRIFVNNNIGVLA